MVYWPVQGSAKSRPLHTTRSARQKGDAMITWLIINCGGISEQIRRTLMDTAGQRYNPHYYESTPWLEDASTSDKAVPTIQVSCQSQSEATRLRKKLRDACASYATSIPHPRNPGKAFVNHPLDRRIFFRYVDEDGNDLSPEQMPKRIAG